MGKPEMVCGIGGMNNLWFLDDSKKRKF